MADKQLTKVISEPEIGPKKEPSTSGYFITEKGLNRITDVINEVPTRYGMVLIKILQEELQRRD